LSETDAVERLKRGDRAALNDLYTTYAHPAVRIAFSVTGSEAAAEDAVQEAFIQVIRSVSTLRDPASFRPWFYRIVVNAAKRLSRNTFRSIPLELGRHDRSDPSAITPDEAVVEAEEIKLLWAAITELDEAHRVPIVLRYFIKLSEHEIAEILRIPAGTVKSRLHTARKTLHQRLIGVQVAPATRSSNRPIAPTLRDGGINK
jgi:RNA polymerase sigma factor (sigma-70 family)